MTHRNQALADARTTGSRLMPMALTKYLAPHALTDHKFVRTRSRGARDAFYANDFSDSGLECLVALGPQKVRKMIAIHRLSPTVPVAVEALFAQVSTPFQRDPVVTVGSRHTVECFPWYY
jgi:hypothetical protein